MYANLAKIDLMCSVNSFSELNTYYKLLFPIICYKYLNLILCINSYHILVEFVISSFNVQF